MISESLKNEISSLIEKINKEGKELENIICDRHYFHFRPAKVEITNNYKENTQSVEITIFDIDGIEDYISYSEKQVEDDVIKSLKDIFSCYYAQIKEFRSWLKIKTFDNKKFLVGKSLGPCAKYCCFGKFGECNIPNRQDFRCGEDKCRRIITSAEIFIRPAAFNEHLSK